MNESVDPSHWPDGSALTDDEALTVARLILDGKPRSYVEGAKRLAQYVINLNLEIEERSAAIADLALRDLHDTERPPSVPEGTFTEKEREGIIHELLVNKHYP
jgi:hypothetical protein